VRTNLIDLLTGEQLRQLGGISQIVLNHLLENGERCPYTGASSQAK
jgi:hypothetical protein